MDNATHTHTHTIPQFQRWCQHWPCSVMIPLFLEDRTRRDAALSAVCSLHKRPSRLFVSVRLVAFARRWRRSSVLHWVVSPLEVRAWVRGLIPSPQVTHSPLPVQNRGWEGMVAQGIASQTLWVAVRLCTSPLCDWQSKIWYLCLFVCLFICLALPALIRHRRAMHPDFCT